VSSQRRLITAIDTADLSRARGLATSVAPHCGLIKLGLEFFLRNGPQGLAFAREMPVFLDLKLHDIPNTVAGAVRALLPLGVQMLTVHAGGGSAMVAAARAAADAAGAARPLILAVTVLTSLDTEMLGGTGVTGGTQAQVLRLGRLAMAAGADGLVCSAHEITVLREALGDSPVLVVPGIRPEGCESGDQARVMTPQAAVRAGADYIVVGRPITGAADPGLAAAEIAAKIA
jgi:orotidine-5'-phosphate decarboxylase